MATLAADVGGYYAPHHSLVPPFVAGIAIIVLVVAAVVLAWADRHPSDP